MTIHSQIEEQQDEAMNDTALHGYISFTFLKHIFLYPTFPPRESQKDTVP
jgi:hypothetical protein